MGKTLTISMVAAKTDLSVDTIRFYERKGLIPKPARNSAGYRIYTQAIVERIQFIKRARAFGFSLNEIENLLAINNGGGPQACSGMKERIENRINEIDSDIDRLRQARTQLVRLVGICAECDRRESCTLIKTIQQS